MAIKQTRVDDFDGKSEDAQPVFFSLDDVFFTLDLCEANKKKLADALKPFIDKASPTDAPRGGRRSPASAYQNGYIDADPAKVRAWCAEQGIDVNDRGRVPEELTNRYKAAMAAKAEENK